MLQRTKESSLAGRGAAVPGHLYKGDAPLLRSVGAATTKIGLAGVAAIHLLWAAGVDWPASSRDELADLVVGARPFPSGPMTLGVVGLVGLGTALVTHEVDRLSQDRPVREQVERSGLVQKGIRLGAFGVPTVLALRGVGGLIASALELGDATARFRYWDLRLYSPLCLLLAVAAAAAVRPVTAG